MYGDLFKYSEIPDWANTFESDAQKYHQDRMVKEENDRKDFYKNLYGQLSLPEKIGNFLTGGGYNSEGFGKSSDDGRLGQGGIRRLYDVMTAIPRATVDTGQRVYHGVGSLIDGSRGDWAGAREHDRGSVDLTNRLYHNSGQDEIKNIGERDEIGGRQFNRSLGDYINSVSQIITLMNSVPGAFSGAQGLSGMDKFKAVLPSLGIESGATTMGRVGDMVSEGRGVDFGELLRGMPSDVVFSTMPDVTQVGANKMMGKALDSTSPMWQNLLYQGGGLVAGSALDNKINGRHYDLEELNQVADKVGMPLSQEDSEWLVTKALERGMRPAELYISLMSGGY